MTTTDLDKIRDFATAILKRRDEAVSRFGSAGAALDVAAGNVAHELLALLDSLPAPPTCPECEAPADHCAECGTPYPPWLVRAALRAS